METMFSIPPSSSSLHHLLLLFCYLNHHSFSSSIIIIIIKSKQSKQNRASSLQILSVFEKMERTPGVFTRRQRPDKIQKTVHSPAVTEELHVLAVDDSLIDRKVIERLLKISSCKVTTVDSGWRALQYLGLAGDNNGSVGFDGLKVNLIITDYWMPGMTGYELLKKIKESSTFKEIPVVIMSSENVQPRINRCLEEGAEEFIVKPVKLSDVKRLKDYITRDDEEVEEEKEQEVLKVAKQEGEKEKGTNKRKLEEEIDHEKEEMNTNRNDVCVSSTTSLSTSPASSMVLSPSPTSTLSSASSSPSSSPSRRLKTTDDNID